VPNETVFLFAGQGSQVYGMGRPLRAIHPVFDSSLRVLDTMFGDVGLPGILDEMYREDRGPTDPFDRFAHTHPAILMVELALLDMLLAEDVHPDVVVGTSLGEYAAAAAAGVLDREDLTRAIAAQVRLTEELCPPGGMAAVLGDVTEFDPDSPQWSGLEVAAVNYDRHFVVSGSPGALDALELRSRADGTAIHRLPVRFAFHSAQVDAVAEPYQRMMATIPLRPPTIDLVSCATGTFTDEVTPEHMWRTVRGPIRFADAIRSLEREREGLRYVDLGPSPTLATFATHNFRPGSGSTAIALLDPFAPPDRGLTRVRETARRAAVVPPEPTAVLFPGQGSQALGMADGLFAEFPDLVAEADEILGYSVAELCLRDPRDELRRTEFTQPALFVANALHYRAWQREHGDGARFFAGHSLGEYNALWAAGAFDFATGLRLVRRRGELMSRTVDGGMAAVLGLGEEQVRAVLAEHGLDEVALANINSADQLVVSGPRETVRGARQAFLDAGARAYLPLRVDGAFHTRHMAPAAAEFARFLAGEDLRAPRLPVISNVTGRPYPDGDIRPVLTEQLVNPVRWEQSVRHLLDQGVTHLVEVGPGTVLTKLVSRIRDAGNSTVDSPVGPAGAANAGQGLGSAAFRAAHGVRYAYAIGSMYHGISSAELVVRAGRAGLLAFFGTGGLDLDQVGAAVRRIRGELGALPFGMGLPHAPAVEDAQVDLFLRERVRVVEASGFTRVTPALARYRAAGLTREAGVVVAGNRVVAKVSRAETAEHLLRPVPPALLAELLAAGRVTAEQAELAAAVPVADDVCVEADSGGYTDRGAHVVLLPAVRRLRDRIAPGVRVGAAGGLGTPEAVAAAFLLGADFVLTGSVNLCTAESGISAVAKDMLERITVADTDYAPAADGFELGGQAQVLARGVFFPARARRLHELYQRHASLDDLDERTRTVVQQRWFRRGFDEVWRDVVAYFSARDPGQIERAERDPRHRMALVFRWYLAESRRLAVAGEADRRVDFQVHCGPALGAFNQWVAGTGLERWSDRHVDHIAERLMTAAADHLGPVGASA
jgi:trans-AT polyketide synthase, acyltransferase and oxidoreductase domains